MFKRLFFALLIVSAAYVAYLSTLDETKLPPLKDGDLIFQTTWIPGATMAIGLASGSLYIHTGIIRHTDNGAVVIHAGQQVEETPLPEWVAQGMFGRFSVYRYRGLSEEQAAGVLEAAKAYYGRHYDHYFSFDNDAIYCSELEYLAFRDAGLDIGRVEKISGLRVNNRFVRKLIEQRWQHYPACAGKGYTFDQCYDVIMAQELVTPASIARDSRVERIFTNYP